MKTMTPSNSPRRLPVALAAALATLLASPVSSVFAQSFPPYPLQIGNGAEEPNILFILDDSGSMADWRMINTDIPVVCRRDNSDNCQSSYRHTITNYNYVSNTVYYDPSVDYEPWISAAGRMSGGTSFTSVYGSFNFAGDGYGDESNTINLRSSSSCNDYDSNGNNDPDEAVEVCGGTQTFHVPKSLTNFDEDYLADSSNYYKYEIFYYGSTTYVIRSELVSGGGPGIAVGTAGNRSRNWDDVDDNDTNDFFFDVVAGGTISVTTGGGSGNVTLRLYKPDGSQVNCTNNNSNNGSCSVNIANAVAGRWRIELFGNNFDNVDLSVAYRGSDRLGCGGAYGVDWGNCTSVNSPIAGRSMADELTNYATWFSYHRTRMKIAKAGASEAFSALGDNVRVGYRTIWNRQNFDIPVNDGNGGLFESTSRDTWFGRLLGAQAYNGTPLHGALQDAGEYFSDNTSEDNPYGPEEGEEQLGCRQNFAILTTDGFWNSSNSYTESSVGDEDGTDGPTYVNSEGNSVQSYVVGHPYRDTSGAGRSDTLADVAMKYWKNDLVADLPNVVIPTDKNKAFWQHMVTFGISIGLKGNVDQTSVDDFEDGDRPKVNDLYSDWPNPWFNGDGVFSDSNASRAESAARIDDLLHAAVNGRGEFIAASSAKAFESALTAVLGSIQASLSSGSNVATNSTTFQDDTRMYQATFYSERWDGDLTAFDVTALGGISSTAAWSASDQAAAAGADFVNRTVLTWETGNGEDFPTATQEAALARVSGDAPVTGANNALYLRGDQTWEMAGGEADQGFVLRDRVDLLGDIINSSPFYVKESNSIFIGANDGMLHGIDAANGTVLFSYVPAGISMSELATRSDPDYEHKYFVDGPIAVSGFAASPNQNVLVGTLGRGGKGAFALDVTEPDNMDGGEVLWDKTATTDADMGYVLGVPLVLRGNNDELLAIVPNGIDSTNGDSVLYVYDAETGTQLSKLSTGNTSGNGLSSPRAADIDNDGKVDYVYAGDLLGNVWKFDLSDDDPANWAVAHGGLPLFTATTTGGVAQPITGGLVLTRDADDNIWIGFGTGRLISNDDVTDTSVQTLYGIIDGDDVIAGRDELTERDIPFVGTSVIVQELPDDEVPEGGEAADDDDITVNVRGFEGYSPLPSGSRGWALDLDNPANQGERVISGARLYGSALWMSSVIPTTSEDCKPGGDGWLNVLSIFTGTSPGAGGGSGSTSYMDLDGDGEGDLVGPGDGVGLGSINLGVGMPTESRQVDELVLVCGSDGTCGSVETPPPGPGEGGEPGRLNWRELVEGDD